jgi:glutathione peroxidase
VAFGHLVPVRTFVNGIEAEVARSVLEAAGIRALVERDDCGGTRPSLWLTGIAVLVRSCDLDAARTLLSTPAIYAAPEDASGMPTGPSTIYGFEAVTIEGNPISISHFRHQVMLVVNVASRCGFTPQYRGLEDLYRKYRDDGFVILGFPCDQFGHQEPGSNEEIRGFCWTEYDVTFPLFSKIDVNGPRAHPLYVFLKTRRKGWLGSEAIKWNFTKFLVGRDGDVLRRFAPTDNAEIIEPSVLRALSIESQAQRG